MAEIKKKKPEFQRTKFRAYVKLGAGQKSKRRYRKAKGRHNKTRQKWKSRPKRVEIGYKNEIANRGLIRGKTPVIIRNTAELSSIKGNQIAVLGKIGLKKKIEILHLAEERKIGFANINVKKFLRKIKRAEERREKMKKEKKEVKPKEEYKGKKDRQKEQEEQAEKIKKSGEAEPEKKAEGAEKE